MVSVVKAGTAIRFAIEPGVGGHPSTAHSVSVALTIAGVEVHRETLPFAEATANGFMIPGSATRISGRRQFAVSLYEFLDENGGLIAAFTDEMVIESENLLTVGENSFASFQDLILESFDMIDINTFRDAPKEEQLAALITAYYNIGSMSVSLFRHRDLADPMSIEQGDLIKIVSTRLLTAQNIALLKPSVVKQLVRCQLAEADSILGGNPIERQRIMGLLSHAAGESTHFYRTSKPLELPISKRAAVELRGIINYAVRIGR